MFSTNLLAVLLCALVQDSWVSPLPLQTRSHNFHKSLFLSSRQSRYIALSLNMSMSLDDEHQQQQQQQTREPSLTAAVLRTCMKETELSMAELQRFRLSLLTGDPDALNNPTEGSVGGENDDAGGLPDGTEIDGIVNDAEARDGDGDGDGDDDGDDDGIVAQYNVMDYDETTAALNINGKNDVALQCFAYCLYEQLGLVSNGVYMEEELFAKLYAVIGSERHLVKECMNLNTNNKCESSYKMHLCYERLKTLEEERRLRHILEYELPAHESLEQEQEQEQEQTLIASDEDAVKNNESNAEQPQGNEIERN